MPGDQAELASLLKKAKSGTMSFAFLAKGTEGRLLLDRKKVSAKEISEAKKELGGGTVYKGRVQGEEGSLVFELGKEAPGSLASVTKKSIKRDAGLSLDVVYRVAADLVEENEGESEDSPGADNNVVPPAPPPPLDAPALINRLNALTGAIKEAMAGTNRVRVQALFMEANGAIKSNDYALAGRLLDSLESLLGQSKQ
jgi:hypothetical protein